MSSPRYPLADYFKAVDIHFVNGYVPQAKHLNLEVVGPRFQGFEDVHLYKKPVLKEVLCILDIVFTGIFIVEMFCKMIAYGLTKYFTSFWTLLDFIVVVVSLTLEGYCVGIGRMGEAGEFPSRN